MQFIELSFYQRKSYKNNKNELQRINQRIPLRIFEKICEKPYYNNICARIHENRISGRKQLLIYEEGTNNKWIKHLWILEQVLKICRVIWSIMLNFMMHRRQNALRKVVTGGINNKRCPIMDIMDDNHVTWKCFKSCQKKRMSEII